jgi:hypothetical protein
MTCNPHIHHRRSIWLQDILIKTVLNAIPSRSSGTEIDEFTVGATPRGYPASSGQTPIGKPQKRAGTGACPYDGISI